MDVDIKINAICCLKNHLLPQPSVKCCLGLVKEGMITQKHGGGEGRQ